MGRILFSPTIPPRTANHASRFGARMLAFVEDLEGFPKPEVELIMRDNGRRLVDPI